MHKVSLGEAKESARRLGIEYDVLDNHDGQLLPTLDRGQVHGEPVKVVDVGGDPAGLAAE